MNFVEVFFNVLGFLGAAILLFGFYRVNSGKWSNKSLWFELDNLIGAVFLVVYTAYYHAYISAALNLVWMGIAVMGIVVFFRRLHGHRKKRKTQRII